MCGAQDALFIAAIEGSEMNVCYKCSKYGKIIKRIKTEKEIKKEKEQVKTFIKKKQQRIDEDEDIMELIVMNYSNIVKDKRAEMGLTQEQLAKRLKEKTSVIQKIESGSFRLSIPLARKIEKNLGVILIEKVKDVKKGGTKADKRNLTIGDMINFKR